MGSHRLGGRYIKGNGITTYDALVEFGANIKALRISLNATQEELREHSGVSLTVIQRLERGKAVSTSNLVKLLRSLNSLPELMTLYKQPEISLEDEWKLRQKKSKSTKQRIRHSN